MRCMFLPCFSPFFENGKAQPEFFEIAIYKWEQFFRIYEKKANRKLLFLQFAIYFFGYSLKESSKKTNRISWFIRMRFTIHSKTASTAFKMIIAFTGEEKCDLFPASSSFSAPRLFPETHAFLQAEGQTCPLACCLPHVGGWKCGQGQATRWVVACRV